MSEQTPELTPDQQKQLDQLTKQFTIDTHDLKRLCEATGQEMQKGLATVGATVPMIPAYVISRPTGEETGTYLALDLGGTNLRVCSVTLHGQGRTSICHRKFRVPDDRKVGSSDVLFDFIAECVYTFLNEASTEDDVLPSTQQQYQLGFTFSFPLNQTAIDRGTIMYWNKGFDLPDAVGKDVIQLLQAALHRRNLDIQVSAVVNDTVGCLLASAYCNPTTQIAVIFGTGTNAAYYERVSEITKWAEDSEEASMYKDGEMIINTEWGAFDNERNVLPRTRFDARVDRMTGQPFSQLFEKMISGMYLGEIVRLVLLELIDRRCLFDGHSSDKFNEIYTFHTAYMSEIEADQTPDLEKTRRVLEDNMSMPSALVTFTDCYIVKEVCKLVGLRAARLGAAALAATLLRRPEMLGNKITIGADGSLFEHYPGFHDRVMDALEEILGGEVVRDKIELTLARDGSGIGAAIGAMLASKAKTAV
jgi:hexokinase